MSFRPFVWASSWNWIIGMLLETCMKLPVAELDILEKVFLPQNRENGPEIWFFQFIKKFGHQFLLNLLYNEN